jgi:Flp pilus assembly pilin Flp
MRPSGERAAEGLSQPHARMCTGIGPRRTREDGQTIPEYALIIAALAVILIISMVFLAGKVGDLFHKSAPAPSIKRPPTASCDPNYAGACLPPYPPDLDCADLRALGIGQVRVIGSDPHGLDPDHDGIACD